MMKNEFWLNLPVKDLINLPTWMDIAGVCYIWIWAKCQNDKVEMLVFDEYLENW